VYVSLFLFFENLRILIRFNFSSDFFMKKNIVAKIAPSVSASMSFWASQISPWEPRNAAPAAGSDSAAYIHSIISYPAATVTIANIENRNSIHFDLVRSFLCRNSAMGYA